MKVWKTLSRPGLFPAGGNARKEKPSNLPVRYNTNGRKAREVNGPLALGVECLNVDYRVQYRDDVGDVIGTVNWEGPFELENEREKAFRKRSMKAKDAVFSVVTVLRTSVSHDMMRFAQAAMKTEIITKGILDDPKIAVTVQTVKLFISSPLFIDILKAVVSYDTGNLLEAAQLSLSEPFAIIGHHLEELEKYTQRSEDYHDATITGMTQRKVAEATVAVVNDGSLDQETRAHVGLVLDFVNRTLRDPIAQEQARYRQDSPTCTFRMLWFLFRPGRTVYADSDGTKDACVIDSVDPGEFSFSCPFEHLQPCSINLWRLDFNGQYITRVHRSIKIRPFNGERPIVSLDVVPCNFWDEHDGNVLRTQLEDRGKKWVDHLSGKQVEYRGEPGKPGKKALNGRAYVDCASYYDLEDTNVSEDAPSKKNKGMSKRKSTEWAAYDRIDVENIDGSVVLSPLLSLTYLLCPRELKGFMFSTRAWETLDVRFCQPTKPDQSPFAKLVMPDERKTMIKALVYKYTDPRYAGGNLQQVWGADFIKHKGEGQIFLLHGGPGVGKTFTAECIAEFTGRPLLALTCGDIGTEEVQMEKKLRYWLRLAYNWGAVMLIDEADVFLEKRLEADIKRNSLVSVFLREIEYYQGILFLTSNRVGRFDDAIVSRIHVIIHYKDLDDNYRRKIWNQFFDKLGDERRKTIRIDNSARRYVLENPDIIEARFNGREIRNAFQTAVALAEYRFLTKPELERTEGETAVLEENDFRQICDMTMKFKAYLADVNDGMDEQTGARLDKARSIG